MSLNHKIIGIAGNAGSGKDTLGENFEKILHDQGIKSKRLSFAYELRKSVDKFLLEQTGISAFTSDKKEKDLILHLLQTRRRRILSDHFLFVGELIL